MTGLRLYSGPLSMFGAKAEIALREKRLAFDLITVPFDREDRYRPKHPDVVRINPKGQVPVLIHGDVELFDSTQIFEYLEDAFPEPALWPADPAGRARARQLELWSDEVAFPNIVRLFGREDTPDDPIAVEARDVAGRHYADLDARLEASDFLAGPFTYADIAVFMAQLFGERKGACLTNRTPRLLRWRARMLERPAVRTVAGRMGRWLRSQGRAAPSYLDAAIEGVPAQ